jgi:hypothetical protein
VPLKDCRLLEPAYWGKERHPEDEVQIRLAGKIGAGKWNLAKGVCKEDFLSVRNRIEPALAERVAAQQASKREPGAAENSEAVERDVGVLRAGGQVTALRWAEGVKDGRENGLVEAPCNEDGAGLLLLTLRFLPQRAG